MSRRRISNSRPTKKSDRRNFNSKFALQRSLTNLIHTPVYTCVDASKTKGGFGFRRSELLFQGFVPRQTWNSWQNPLRQNSFRFRPPPLFRFATSVYNENSRNKVGPNCFLSNRLASTPVPENFSSPSHRWRTEPNRNKRYENSRYRCKLNFTLLGKRLSILSFSNLPPVLPSSRITAKSGSTFCLRPWRLMALNCRVEIAQLGK